MAPSAKYTPFVNAYGKIPELFAAIKKASVPTKVTHDFIYSVLGLKSTSFRAMIPLLKNLGFIDANNVPTQYYKEYRDDSLSRMIMAERVKQTYSIIYQAHEYAHTLTKSELTSKFKTVLGVGDDDNLTPVVGTFSELVKLSDFDEQISKHDSKVVPKEKAERESSEGKSIQHNEETINLPPKGQSNFSIGYNINLNLPATTDIEVYNVIFKALKENLLND